MIKEIKHKSFRRAYVKGKIAANIGLDKDNCPYQDKRNKKGGATWSKIFRRYWFDGFDDNVPEGFKLLDRTSR